MVAERRPRRLRKKRPSVVPARTVGKPLVAARKDGSSLDDTRRVVGPSARVKKPRHATGWPFLPGDGLSVPRPQRVRGFAGRRPQEEAFRCQKEGVSSVLTSPLRATLLCPRVSGNV